MTSSFRDWTWIPPELLDFIAKNLDQLSDFISFRGVCTRWRKVALESDIGHNQSLAFLKLSRKKLPLLLIKTQEHNDDTRGLYSVSDGVTYKLQLPLPCKHRFFGSSHGWLMYFDHESMNVTLFNPLNNSCISLPNLKASWSLPSYYMVKGILSADPTLSPDNFTVAVIYDTGSHRLAVYNSGYMHWKFVNTPHYGFIDIAFHEGYVYGVTVLDDLIQIDIGSLAVKTTPIPFQRATFNYVVESQGDLLLVQRCWLIKIINCVKDESQYCSSKTVNFEVYKLVNKKKGAGKWIMLDKIGDQALFVGGNNSVSVSTLEFPECSSNSIYYTSQLDLHYPPYKCRGLDEDSGIFCLEDKSFHSHHILDTFNQHMEPPIWFVPILNLAASAS